ncbi:LamB/YcsF family protein [Paraburkholderia kirstenboschensis]|uniref:5-oxoprolinase subunit A n=1 Tax=Paraburkholderia kirstenboschensis TaxID=1245436 RepID=A0ABZ0EKM3_9BURK|nr:5-oxoprolinase subunit PxpA [Paraburkholderia kirstenboschensis]WOD17004.1 5-oxoprolinase subunit PxpA [Paraburkholderia kirstenboschensis]
MNFVDLNSDMGEGFGPYEMGDDEAMLDIVSSANIACGFHAGDPDIMHRTVVAALARGVDVGAHPGFNDVWGFGRRTIVGDSIKTIENLIAYQIGALRAIAYAAGYKVTHFKTHGALGNLMFKDREISDAIARAVKAVDRELLYVIPPNTEGERAGERAGLHVLREVFADRAYTDEGHLVSRRQEGAVIHDKDEAAERVVRMVEDRCITTHSGKRIPVQVDSICVHGDTAGAVAMAFAVKTRLLQTGVEIRPLSKTFKV